jgi:hypothetical protein
MSSEPWPSAAAFAERAVCGRTWPAILWFLASCTPPSPSPADATRDRNVAVIERLVTDERARLPSAAGLDVQTPPPGFWVAMDPNEPVTMATGYSRGGQVPGWRATSAASLSMALSVVLPNSQHKQLVAVLPADAAWTDLVSILETGAVAGASSFAVLVVESEPSFALKVFPFATPEASPDPPSPGAVRAGGPTLSFLATNESVNAVFDTFPLQVGEFIPSVIYGTPATSGSGSTEMADDPTTRCERYWASVALRAADSSGCEQRDAGRPGRALPVELVCPAADEAAVQAMRSMLTAAFARSESYLPDCTPAYIGVGGQDMDTRTATLGEVLGLTAALTGVWRSVNADANPTFAALRP